jgi:putative ABC transport system permease protein
MGLIGLNVESPIGTMELQSFNLMAVGEDILPVLGIELVEGRDFSQKFLTDIGQSIMVNQTLVDQMGWGDQAIGK